MLIKRENYIQQLKRKQWNGRIKILTGIRRCGKSTILFDIFRNELIRDGFPEENIVALALDDDANEKYRDPHILSEYVRKRCSDEEKKYIVLLDEIQYAISRNEIRNPDKPVRLYSVLNGFLHMKNIDVFVTGSNSKLLSHDVSTEFRGRGDIVQIYPLSFREYMSTSEMDPYSAYDMYAAYGGMPYLLNLEDETDKYDYLRELFEEIYFKDIEERYTVQLPGVLREMTSSLCSSVGSLTNANKIARTVRSVKNIRAGSETISTYLGYLTESFLFSKADRYDIKGKKYFEYPSKYYCTDVGLRNARLGMRQQEPTHIMENIIYNELLIRGFLVDVGVIEISGKNDQGKRSQRNHEIDFVVQKAGKKYYIQSAYSMEDEDKQRQELVPLLAINDSFKKIVISRTYGKSWTDDHGILRIGLTDFLLDENSLDR